MTVPYTFANQIGPIPLLELDQNFAAISAGVDTAITVTGNAQPNITSVGVLNSLTLNSNFVSLGRDAGGPTGGNIFTVAIGAQAGNNDQGANSVAIGRGAGRELQGSDCVAVGSNAGQANQYYGAVAIGRAAGNTNQFSNAVAVGREAGFLNQSTEAVALGQLAGANRQGIAAVAIGSRAAISNQGGNSVAIGAYAGNPFCAQNTIVINGLPGNLNAPTASALYIAPIRNDNANVATTLYYNTSTYEITYAPAGASSSIANGNSSVTIPTTNGNVNVAVGGNTVSIFTSGGLSTVGNIDATDITVANTVTATTFIGTFQGNISGNLVVPGANTWVLYNNNGNAGADIGFRYNAATDDVFVGNAVTAAYFIGDGSLLTNLPIGNYSNANVADYLPTFSGNISAGNVNAVYLYGDGSNVTNLPVGNYSNSNVASYLVTYSGNIDVDNITTTGNATGNIGSNANPFNTIFATATTALYADLAEMYAADQHYISGTVLEIGGTQEVCATTSLESTAIAGVVSTNPSYTMNSGITADFPVTVALLGRVPTRVVGTIKKGQILVSSSIPGVATAGVTVPQGSIVGKALQDYDSQEEGIIEVLVGRI